MLCISVKEFLLWKKKQLSKGGDQQSFEVLLDCIGDISTRDLNLKILNPKGNLYLKNLIKILMKIFKKFMIGQLKTKVIFGVVSGISQKLKALKATLKSKNQKNFLKILFYQIQD